MRNFLRDLAWCVQDVVEAFYPLEREPSMWDLEAAAAPDPVVEAVELLRDIRNILSSSVEHRADAPDVVSPASVGVPRAAEVGHPNDDPMFGPSDLFGAAQTLLCLANGRRRKAKDHDEHLRALGARLAEIANAMK